MDLDLSSPADVKKLRLHMRSLSNKDSLAFARSHPLLMRAVRTLEGGMFLQRHQDLGLTTRTASEEASIDMEKRTVDETFSSETPVERWFGIEILRHNVGDPDLTWATSGNAPVLWQHDTNILLGRILPGTAVLDSTSKKCRCVRQYDTEEPGNTRLKQKENKSLRNVSFAYAINAWDRTESSDEDTPDTYTITSWTVQEVSDVTLPADQSVGAGRSLRCDLPIPDTRTQPVIQINPTTPMLAEIKPRTPAEERARVAHLTAIRDQHGRSLVSNEEFDALINDDAKTVDESEIALTRMIGKKKQSDAMTSGRAFDATPVVGAADAGGFSVREMLAEFVAGSGKLKTGLYRDASTETAARMAGVAKNVGADSEGNSLRCWIPNEILRPDIHDPTFGGFRMPTPSWAKRTAQNVQSGPLGGYAVNTTLSQEYLDFLRPVPQMQKAGAVLIGGAGGSGLGNIRFLKGASDAVAQFTAPGVATTASNMTFEFLEMTPHRCTATVILDRQALFQPTFSMDALVRNTVNMQLALVIDLAGLLGTGNKMPLGLFNTPGIQTAPAFTGTNLSPSYSDVVGFRTLVLSKNAGLLGKRTHISSPESQGNYALTPKISTGSAVYPEFLLDDNDCLRGEKFLETSFLNSLPSTLTAQGFSLPLVSGTPTADMQIYGPFSQYIFIEWAGTEVLFNPYTYDDQDLVKLTFRTYIDGGCKYPQAFVKSAGSAAIAW